MGHTSLVGQESGQMDRLGGVILGECLYSALVAGSTLPRGKSHRTMARGGEFTMRLEAETKVRLELIAMFVVINEQKNVV